MENNESTVYAEKRIMWTILFIRIISSRANKQTNKNANKQDDCRLISLVIMFSWFFCLFLYFPQSTSMFCSVPFFVSMFWARRLPPFFPSPSHPHVLPSHCQCMSHPLSQSAPCAIARYRGNALPTIPQKTREGGGTIWIFLHCNYANQNLNMEIKPPHRFVWTLRSTCSFLFGDSVYFLCVGFTGNP